MKTLLLLVIFWSFVLGASLAIIEENKENKEKKKPIKYYELTKYELELLRTMRLPEPPEWNY